MQDTSPDCKLHPITIIGAGGIVRDAHLPAYRKAGFRVEALCDLDYSRARSLADAFDMRNAYGNACDAIRNAPARSIFDIAVPPESVLDVLPLIPDRAPVLIQKPMGLTIEDARRIREICRRKKLTAAVNFQLRFAPNIAVARQMIEEGRIGQIHDMEVRVTVFTPWHLWTFLEKLPRMEIPLHSIHYLDLIRSFLGEPRAVWAHTVKHPNAPKLASTRSHIILDYGDMMNVNVETNHGHNFGLRHQESYVKWEGTRGAIKTTLGLLLDYPRGVPDQFEYCILEPNKPPLWQSLEIQGSWFPDAFVGVMQSLMDYVEGRSKCLPASVEDAYRTMELVEAAYESNAEGGTRVSHD
ncbi:MAG: Gfo/Idh/MocA family oxidoreductase [Acidobacteriaceae bacterium]|nr:Gfo/Idh/MocA family oxidoreductase [Acidobacteriaceae bacterium]